VLPISIVPNGMTARPLSVLIARERRLLFSLRSFRKGYVGRNKFIDHLDELLNVVSRSPAAFRFATCSLSLSML
jgi:hypothetical protein